MKTKEIPFRVVENNRRVYTGYSLSWCSQTFTPTTNDFPCKERLRKNRIRSPSKKPAAVLLTTYTARADLPSSDRRPCNTTPARLWDVFIEQALTAKCMTAHRRSEFRITDAAVSGGQTKDVLWWFANSFVTAHFMRSRYYYGWLTPLNDSSDVYLRSVFESRFPLGDWTVTDVGIESRDPDFIYQLEIVGSAVSPLHMVVRLSTCDVQNELGYLVHKWYLRQVIEYFTSLQTLGCTIIPTLMSARQSTTRLRATVKCSFDYIIGFRNTDEYNSTVERLPVRVVSMARWLVRCTANILIPSLVPIHIPVNWTQQNSTGTSVV